MSDLPRSLNDSITRGLGPLVKILDLSQLVSLCLIAVRSTLVTNSYHIINNNKNLKKRVFSLVSCFILFYFIKLQSCAPRIIKLGQY